MDALRALQDLAPAPAGTTVHAECIALHRGRRTMVWPTRITGANERRRGIVTQTQMVLEPAAGLTGRATRSSEKAERDERSRSSLH